MKLEVGRDEANLLYFKLNFTLTNTRVCWIDCSRLTPRQDIWYWTRMIMRNEIGKQFCVSL